MDTQEAVKERGSRPVRRRYRVNKKRLARFFTLVGCFIAAIACAFVFTAVPQPVLAEAAPLVRSAVTVAATLPLRGPLDGKTVVVDAGHGGFDIGATGVSGVHESSLNLQVAAYLQADLEEEGARVIMTRADENAIGASKEEDMAKRRQVILQSGADVVVSIHMNADTNPNVSGPVVLYQPGAQQSEKLAKLIQSSLLDRLSPASQNSARAQNLYILERNSQPGVLVECGFISNAQEEALLVQAAYQQKIAQAITAGCVEFLD